jgi:hypothetical protein
VESVAVYQINGDSFFLLKTEDGQLWHGWLGNPNSFYAYSLDIPVKRAKDFAISRGGLLVIDETGAVWQTKPLDFINMTWSQVTGLKNIRQVAVGDSHYLAVRSDGTIFAWGKNDKGQLGDGTTDDSDTPVEVLGVKARVP